jgi:hypothetical protein
MSSIYNKLSLGLLNKFLINLYLNKLNLKLFFITSRTNNLPIEYIIRNNCAFELNIMLSYDILFFIL